MRKNLLLLLTTLFTTYSFACSAFFFNSKPKLFAKNFDWNSGDGYLLKNNKGQKKYAYGFRGENVADWISKYGSVTFNQNGKEFPYGGINEKGLVIEQLWLESTEYQDNKNKTISELEWIQYQLDNYASVDEVVENVNNLAIKPIAKIHYFLADKTGTSAVIDFVNGKAIVNRNIEKHQVITNEIFKDSKDYFSNVKNIDVNSRNAFDRYSILKSNLNVDELRVNDAFSKLDLVRENRPNYKTFWSIVYDIDNLEIHFKSFENENVKKISLSELNFDQNSAITFSPINTDVIKFRPYSSYYNLMLLSKTIKMMNFEIQLEKANNHQMNPNQIVVDEIYKNKYTDLIVEFLTKKITGNIWFTLIKGEENFSNYKGFLSGILPIKDTKTRKVFYGIPKGELAIACFQDTNYDSKMDKNKLGIPKNTGFSNNKKRIFGIPPKYETAKIIIDESKEVQVIIK